MERDAWLEVVRISPPPEYGGSTLRLARQASSPDQPPPNCTSLVRARLSFFTILCRYHCRITDVNAFLSELCADGDCMN